MSVPAAFDALTEQHREVVRAAMQPKARAARAKLNTVAQKRAVIASVLTDSKTEACRLAGYSGDNKTLTVTAWRLWNNPLFVAARFALLEEMTTDVGQSFSSALSLYDMAADMARDLGDAEILANVQRWRDDFLQLFEGALNQNESTPS